MEKSLLERLQHHPTEGVVSKRGEGAFAQLTVSVMNNLRKILNTRQGTVRIDPGFGIPDFTLLSGGISVIQAEQVETTILNVIRKYEPRLIDCRVQFKGSSLDELMLKFHLEGTLILDQKRYAIQFKSQMSANSSFEVEYSDS